MNWRLAFLGALRNVLSTLKLAFEIYILPDSEQFGTALKYAPTTTSKRTLHILIQYRLCYPFITTKIEYPRKQLVTHTFESMKK